MPLPSIGEDRELDLVMARRQRGEVRRPVSLGAHSRGDAMLVYSEVAGVLGCDRICVFGSRLARPNRQQLEREPLALPGETTTFRAEGCT